MAETIPMEEASTGGASADVESSSEQILKDNEFIEYMAKALGLKEAGNDYFKSGKQASAVEEYSKGLETLSECSQVTGVGDSGEVIGGATVTNEIVRKIEFNELRTSLQLNLAMAYLKLEQYQDAYQASSKALELESENIKALYRRGVASARLKRYDASLEDLEKILSLEPNNRQAKREISAVRVEMNAKRSAEKKKLSGALKKGKGLYSDVEEERLRKKEREAAEVAAKKRRHAQANEKRSRDGESPISYEEWLKEDDAKRKKLEEEAKKEREAEARHREEQRRLRKKKKQEVEVIDDDDEDEDLGDCRGYKVLPDGRKTSYFTRETDAQTADLLIKANQGPRKLDSNEADQNLLQRTQSSGSAWNAAGTTFEERSQTKWVDDRLRHHLASVHCTLGSEDDHFRVSNVKDLTGEASIAVSRGKTRYIFDYVAKLEWEACFDNTKYKGTLSLPDLSSTITDGSYEQQLKIKSSRTCAALNAGLSTFQDAVNTAISNFVSEYQQRVLR